MFDTEEAVSINSIPLSRIGSPDRLVWHYEKKWANTVNNGYKLLTKAYMEESKQGMRTNQKLWKKIWATSLPRKIQVFLWRILHEILPINMCRYRIWSGSFIVWRVQGQAFFHFNRNYFVQVLVFNFRILISINLGSY